MIWKGRTREGVGLGTVLSSYLQDIVRSLLTLKVIRRLHRGLLTSCWIAVVSPIIYEDAAGTGVVRRACPLFGDRCPAVFAKQGEDISPQRELDDDFVALHIHPDTGHENSRNHISSGPPYPPRPQ